MAVIILDDNKMSTLVEAPTGTPEGTLDVTENGTYNISNYEYVKIEIEE